MKKALSALVLGMALSAGCVAQAGSIPSYMVPLKTYAVRYMDCYLTPGGEPKGYIDAGDYVIVEKIENGWAYGSYPVGSNRISRWFKADDLVNNVAFSNQDRTSPQQTTNTYKTAGYDSVFGSFNNYEPIVVVSDSGEFRQVIYKLSNGGYKMAWVPYWDCWLNGQAGRNEKEERKVNNNTVNKNPIIQPVKREEKKTEQTTTSTTEKGSIKYTSDTFGNASLSGRRIGYVTAGSDIEILAYAGDAYYIRYWTDSGQARERYVNKGAVRKAGEKEEPVNNNDAVAEQVKNKILWMKDNLNGYKAGMIYSNPRGSYCRGFANDIYTRLFPNVSPLSGYTNDNFGADSFSGSYKVGRLTGFGKNDVEKVKAFFANAKPGYFIQMGARARNEKGDPKAHSAIFVGTYNGGCYFYEANVPGGNLIGLNSHTWEYLATNKLGFTIYAPNNYCLK